ncbi:MAG: hypothetical protein O3C27_14120 [Actinomycetota bacterium]|nr:hypothetical protein [Actinomycetota bacterium]
MTPRTQVVAMIALLIVGAGCGTGTASDSELGFVSVDECLQAIPLIQADIDPAGLAERCGAELDQATAALAALPDTTTPTSAVEVTAETTVTTAPSAPETTAVPPTSVSESTNATTNLNPLGGDSPEDALMLDLICWNLQAAQDEIQDHGIFFSRSEDATGQDRMQINDSNWIVVGQSPEPGTPIGEGDAVLSVVKDGEPNNC